MRNVKMVQRIQPLQMDTAVVKPNSVISGKVEQIINVVGTEFSKAIKAELRYTHICLPGNLLCLTASSEAHIAWKYHSCSTMQISTLP